MNRYQRILDSVTEFAIVAMDRDGIVTDWNTGAERILGWQASDRVGRTAEILFTPEDRTARRMATEMATALSAGSGLDERWHMKADGSRFWASGQMMPLRDDAGGHVGFVKVLRDRTDQHFAGTALRDMEAQLRQAQEAGGVGLFTVDVGSGILVGTEEFSRIYGHEHRQARPAQDFEGLVVPEDQELVSNNSTRRVGGSPKDVVYRIRKADTGELRRIERKGEFQLDEDDKPVRFVGIARDVTDRVEAETRLRESEERLLLAVDVGEVGVFDLNLGTGELIWDGRVRAAFGVAAGRTVTQAQKLGAIHPGDRQRFDAAFATAVEGGLFDLQFRTVGLDDRKVRWVLVRGRVVENRDGGRNFIGAVRDVTERIAADERRQVLNGELAHRLKNTLALVSSIVTQTLRTAPDVASARKTLADRILALSKAHDVLMVGQRDAGSIREVVRGASSLHDGGDRVRLSGPDVALGPKAALTLSLIVHELSTNAGKYGSLSVPGGHVEVRWTVAPEPGTGRPNLGFEWREVGGPPVTPPTRRSFGTRLIEMGLSGSTAGTSKLEFAPEGLRCRITASLTELQAEEEMRG